MPDLILKQGVTTLDNKLLAPAGAVLSAELMAGIISSGKSRRAGHFSRTASLAGYGTLKKDIAEFICEAPYNTIFSGAGSTSGLFECMKKIRLAAPLLETLDYFKEGDFYSYRHFLMVFALSTRIAKEFTPDFQRLLQLSAAGPVHDIGKACVPLDIIKKTAPLTKQERSILDGHAAAGYVLLSYYLGDPDCLACRVARDHHERRDGTGYPRGIRLDDILVEIIAVCDVYDALLSARPYRPVCYDNRTALEEITKMAEKGSVRWEVVRALVALNRDAKPHYSMTEISIDKRGVSPPGNLYGLIADNGKGRRRKN
ncbi:MAG: HD domain-containing protein [Nitrospiraceae bacterium]|nr:HD domain-containing protein [Nitrospiraceae bacterium]